MSLNEGIHDPHCVLALATAVPDGPDGRLPERGARGGPPRRSAMLA
ncbi:MAG: hypothetical protein MZU79_09135 [Anaerotruncus sp.]|nr:hypothetical protein [Anaerotruncus sp.]